MIHLATITISALSLWVSCMVGHTAGMRIVAFLTVVAIIRPKYKRLVKRRRW